MDLDHAPRLFVGPHDIEATILAIAGLTRRRRESYLRTRNEIEYLRTEHGIFSNKSAGRAKTRAKQTLAH